MGGEHNSKGPPVRATVVREMGAGATRKDHGRRVDSIGHGYTWDTSEPTASG